MEDNERGRRGLLLDNNKLILVYGYKDEELALIKETLTKNNIFPIKIVEEAMAKMKIRDIIEGLKFETFNNTMPKEKLFLFNNFTDEELNKIIDIIRSTFQQSPILAVVTPTSNEWTFKHLIEHLIEERNWYNEH